MSINTFIWMGKMYRQILLLAAFTCIGQTFAQCTKDIDCKGDRVCVNGKCQESLKQKPPCTRDVDCQGDSLCDHGRCIAEDNKSPRINTSPALTHGNETLSSIAKVESNSQGINKSPENKHPSVPIEVITTDQKTVNVPVRVVSADGSKNMRYSKTGQTISSQISPPCTLLVPSGSLLYLQEEQWLHYAKIDGPSIVTFKINKPSIFAVIGGWTCVLVGVTCLSLPAVPSLQTGLIDILVLLIGGAGLTAGGIDILKNCSSGSADATIKPWNDAPPLQSNAFDQYNQVAKNQSCIPNLSLTAKMNF